VALPDWHWSSWIDDGQAGLLEEAAQAGLGVGAERAARLGEEGATVGGGPGVLAHPAADEALGNSSGPTQCSNMASTADPLK
jgi:hypothetical protein